MARNHYTSVWLLLCGMVLGASLTYPVVSWSHRRNEGANSRAPETVQHPRYDLQDFCEKLPARTGKMQPEEFEALLADVRAYYSGDPYALAHIGYAEASVRRHRYHDNETEAKCLAESLPNIHLVEQELALLELNMRVDLGLAYSMLSQRDPAVVELKRAVLLGARDRPPLFGGDPQLDDKQKRAAFKSAHGKACEWLVQIAKIEQLRGVSISPILFDTIAKNWPEKARVVAWIQSQSAEDNRNAIRWLETQLAGGEGRPYSGEDRKTVQQTVDLLKNWYESTIDPPWRRARYERASAPP